MTTIQVRADSTLKKGAQKVLARLGLDLSTAINLYLVQIIKERGIPFPVVLSKKTPQKKKQ
jgi:DNA-damage-inducible protein J